MRSKRSYQSFTVKQQVFLFDRFDQYDWYDFSDFRILLKSETIVYYHDFFYCFWYGCPGTHSAYRAVEGTFAI